MSVGAKNSSMKNMSTGVPQGSVLGPILYYIYRVSKKIGISDLTYGHMIPFLEPLGPDKCLGSDNKLHDHSQDDHKGLECILVGHLEEIVCLKEYFVIFIWQTLTQPSDSQVTVTVK